MFTLSLRPACANVKGIRAGYWPDLLFLYCPSGSVTRAAGPLGCCPRAQRIWKWVIGYIDHCRACTCSLPPKGLLILPREAGRGQLSQEQASATTNRSRWNMTLTPQRHSSEGPEPGKAEGEGPQQPLRPASRRQTDGGACL